jgi:hypothetical protein
VVPAGHLLSVGFAKPKAAILKDLKALSPPTCAIEARLAACERRRNATATTFNWRFTASDLDDLPRPHRRPRTKVDYGGRPTPTNFRRRPLRAA